MATGQPQDKAIASASTGSGLGAELTVPQTQSITVNHDNVLRAAKIIQDALDGEGQQIRANLPLLQVIAPGEDQISVQAAEAWNHRLSGNADSFSVRVEQYLGNLQQLVDNLVASARRYGYTEQQITDAFRRSGG
jgi:hypothetical protein